MKLKNIYPICVALSEKTAEHTIALGRKFPFVEVRIDLGNFSEQDLRRIFKSLKNAVATCRPGQYDDAAREALLSCALNSGAKFIDIEIESKPALKKRLIQLASKRKVRSIVSYHNFRQTPSKSFLKSVIARARRQGADLVKIATQVRNQKDNRVLLEILSTHENLIVVGMGESGKSIRIAAPMLGGLFTFAAPASGMETAPGQIEFSVLRDIYKNFGLIKS